jgi:hypothetical protein
LIAGGAGILRVVARSAKSGAFSKVGATTGTMFVWPKFTNTDGLHAAVVCRA